VLTIFSTAKLFRGHVGLTQRNALKSWTLLHPNCEVILFGDEPGSREAATELGIRHEPDALRGEYGGTRLDYIFARAQEIARHDLLCYANCDIVFLRSFAEAVSRVADWSPKFLMVGCRWDTPVTRSLDFEANDWEPRLREFAVRVGKRQLPYAVDYFAFSRGLYEAIPPFVVAKTHWDHWMIWKARSTKVPVVDASADVLAIHQNHDPTGHAGDFEALRTDPEFQRNRALAGGQLHLYTIDHATHQLVDGRIKRRSGRWHVPLTSLARVYSSQLWYRSLKATHGIRRAVGLNRASFADASAASIPSKRVESAQPMRLVQNSPNRERGL
jgi:hypothetical protein